MHALAFEVYIALANRQPSKSYQKVASFQCAASCRRRWSYWERGFHSHKELYWNHYFMGPFLHEHPYIESNQSILFDLASHVHSYSLTFSPCFPFREIDLEQHILYLNTWTQIHIWGYNLPYCTPNDIGYLKHYNNMLDLCSICLQSARKIGDWSPFERQ